MMNSRHVKNAETLTTAVENARYVVRMRTFVFFGILSDRFFPFFCIEQIAHWPTHKEMCKSLRGMNSGGGGSSGGSSLAITNSSSTSETSVKEEAEKGNVKGKKKVADNAGTTEDGKKSDDFDPDDGEDKKSDDEGQTA